ncbi:MAG: GAF domain-containing protein [Anaerolineae bacterium]
MSSQSKNSLYLKIVGWSLVPTASILFAVLLIGFLALTRGIEIMTVLTADQVSQLLNNAGEALGMAGRTLETPSEGPLNHEGTGPRLGALLQKFNLGIFWLDRDGSVLWSVPPTPDPPPFDGRALTYPSDEESDTPRFSNLLPGPGRGAIAVSVPVRNADGRLEGTLVGLQSVGLPIVGEEVEEGIWPFFHLILVDGKGRVIHAPDTSQWQQDLSTEEVVRRVLKGEVGSARVRDFNGQSTYVGYAPVPNTPWGLVIEVDWNALLAGQAYRLYLPALIIFFFLGVILPLVIVNVGVIKIMTPINDLIDAAQAVARGDFGRTIEARTGDEIQELAEQFNLMSQQLAASYTQLEQKVAARTHELATLNAIANVVNRSLDLDEVLAEALRESCERLEADAGCALLLDEEGESLDLRAQRGFSEPLLETMRRIRVGEGISGQAVLRGTPMVMNRSEYDIVDPADRLGPLLEAKGIRTLASTPIVYKGETLGALTLATQRSAAFSEGVRALLSAIGQQIGVAVANAQLYAQAQAELAERKRAEDTLRRVSEERARRNRELLLLNRVIGAATSRQEPETVLSAVCQELAQALDVPQAAATLRHDEEETLRVVAEYRAHEARPSAMGLAIPLEGNPATQQVLEEKQPLVIEDAQHDPRMAPAHTVMRQRGTVSILLLPIIVHGEAVGTIGLDAVEPREFTADEIALASSAVAAAAQALENAWAEAALRESEERLKLAIEGADLGLWNLNLQTGHLLWSSTEWGYVPGYIDSQLEDWKQLIHPDDRARVDEGLKAYFSGEAPLYEVEFRMRERDNTWTWVLLRGRAVERDETGAPIRMAGISQDVTARKQAEEELRRAKEAAEAANRAKSVFLANMSHEFRTPLNAILGFTQIMLSDPNLTPVQRENLEIIDRSGTHLLTLINDVLEMSKIEAGRTTLLEQNFDLHRMLDDLEAMFRLRAEERGLTLTVERTRAVPRYVRTDENKLRQVLINLLSNAVKFTEEGEVTLRVAHAGKQLCFEVEDTGPGIAAEELERLFEPFVQTKSGQIVQEGTGLGLPISREFVHLMGGNISVDSTVGQGSTFCFCVRVDLVSEQDVRQTQASREVVGLEPGQPSYRLLVVEDKWANRKLLVRLLEPLGFEVREATNGQEALEIWEHWDPHLIWMDMRMPVMDGHEATQRIKATTKGQATVIIALTASAFERERRLILSEGCDDFVRKPFRKEEIYDRLAEHLGVRFIYAEEQAESRPDLEPEDAEALLTPEALADLPSAEREALHAAAMQADADRLFELIKSLAARDDHNGSQLAAALESLVRNFRFDIIMDLTEGS